MPILLVTAAGYYYAELAVSSLAVVVTTASTHYAYQAEMARLSWPGWFVV